LVTDPVLTSLAGGLVLAGVMTLDDNLAETTREKTFLLAVGYSLILAVLYRPDVFLSGVYSAGVITARINLADLLGTDLANTLWVLSGVGGFTVAASGTRSGKWKFVAGLLFAVFLLVAAAKIWPWKS
jgi:hypothetical protein